MGTDTLELEQLGEWRARSAMRGLGPIRLIGHL